MVPGRHLIRTDDGVIPIQEQIRNIRGRTGLAKDHATDRKVQINGLKHAAEGLRATPNARRDLKGLLVGKCHEQEVSSHQIMQIKLLLSSES